MLSTYNRTQLGDILCDLRSYLCDDSPALSLRPGAYTSPELWQLEQERIFYRSWVLAAHADQLAKAGDYVALSVAGEPVLVVRDGAGELHAMSPVCRHRCMPLVQPGSGHTDELTCQYHRWRYGLDGRLIGAPHMAANRDFEPRQCRLPRFAVATWNGFVWVNLDAGAEPIGAHLDMVAAEFANYRLDTLVQIDSFAEEWQANWKLVLENAHENYHVLGLHEQTLEPLVPGGGDIGVRQYSPWVLRGVIPFTTAMRAESLILNEVQKTNLLLLLTFPTGGFFAMPDWVLWISFIPLSIDRTQVLGGLLTTPELAAGTNAAAGTQPARQLMTMAMVDKINEEDRIGLEAVQRVVSSRFAERGHLSPKEQPGMLAFYRNLAHALVGGGADDGHS